MLVSLTFELSSSDCKTTAPAPSPNKMQLLRSSQSTHRVRASAPTTTAVILLLVKNWPAVTQPNRKPLQAAVKSKATAFDAPIAFATVEASPKRSSGEEVHMMTMSTWEGSMLAISRAVAERAKIIGWNIVSLVVDVATTRNFKAKMLESSKRLARFDRSPFMAASEPRVEMPIGESLVNTLRWEIPVREDIHSSVVSTTVSRAVFGIIVGGEAEPDPSNRRLIADVEVAYREEEGGGELGKGGDGLDVKLRWGDNINDSNTAGKKRNKVHSILNLILKSWKGMNFVLSGCSLFLG